MGWTDERVEILKKLWIEGLSASQIAKQLGGVSRNGVIGKIHRLGMAGRGAASAPQRLAKMPKAPRAPRNPPPRKVFIAPPVVIAPIPEGEPGTATVLTLGSRMCKWPIGDPAHPSFTLCGRRAEEGSYCPAHAELAYQPAKKSSSAADLERSLRRYT